MMLVCRIRRVATAARTLFALAITLDWAACSASKAPAVPDSGASDPGAPAAAGGVTASPLAGMSAVEPNSDAGMTPQSTSHTFATATAQLTALEGASMPLHGSVRWRETTEGVDMEALIDGVRGSKRYPVQILEASDCSAQSLQAPAWSRGDNLPALLNGGRSIAQARLTYSRLGTRSDAWTIGGPDVSELTGHVLVVRAAGGGDVIACAPIERGPDLLQLRPPAVNEPPSSEARGALGGLCFARQFPDSGPGCPSVAGLLKCSEVHCDLGGCLQSCEPYTRCLDSSSEVCTVGVCEASPECTACQSELFRCTLAFCGEHATCAPTITPDGPCQRLSSCCTLQGAHGDPCWALLAPVLTSYGGDANCIGSMNDWDVLSHMHVPCTYGPVDTTPSTTTNEPGETLAPNTEPQLRDGLAGADCATDADCPGGHCATAAGMKYCTRVCTATLECGAGGMCVATGERGTDKRCLAKCQEPAECRDNFICSGYVPGSQLSLPGSCRPKRQVTQLATGVVGRSCTADAECTGGLCATLDLLGNDYPGNYCTGRCYTDAQCGADGVCLWPNNTVDPGYCLKACTTHEDCAREGHGCWEFGDGTRLVHGCYPRNRPLADGTAGKPCEQDAECGAPPARCARELPHTGLTTDHLTRAPGGYCTQPCALDAECGAGSQCINQSTLGGGCLASCSDSAPCRPGYECFLHSRDGDPKASVCVPIFDSATDGADAGL